MREKKRRWQDIANGGVGDSSTGGGEEDPGVCVAELVNGLAASSAGLAGGVVEIGDGDGVNLDVGAIPANRSDDGGLLGAGGQPIGCVFDVATGDDLAVGKQQSRAHTKAAVGRVGVPGDLGCALAKVYDLLCGQTAGMGIFRHDEWRLPGAAADGKYRTFFTAST